MKKILLVVPLSTTKFGSRNAGGLDSVCQLLVEYLSCSASTEFYYRVLAFNQFNDGNYSNVPTKLSDNVELVYFPCKEKKFGIPLPGLLSCNLRVMQQVHEFKPDIIHSHLNAWLLGGFKVKHRIATMHAYKKICRRPQSFLNDLVYEQVIPKIADIFVTEYTVVGDLLFEAITQDTKKNIHIIGNPIASVFLSAERNLSSTQRLRLVTCSLITKRKRIELSISLLKKVRELGINAELVIIGPATDENYVEELNLMIKTYNLEEFVHFSGACNLQEIVEYYQTAQLGLFFSIEETFGLAPLEMIAASIPVISSRVGIIADRINEFSKFPSVLVVDDVDIPFLANKLLPLVSTDVTDAKKFIRSEYSVETILKRYESIYRRSLIDC